MAQKPHIEQEMKELTAFELHNSILLDLAPETVKLAEQIKSNATKRNGQIGGYIEVEDADDWEEEHKGFTFKDLFKRKK